MTVQGDELSKRHGTDDQSLELVDTHCHLHDREFFTEKQAEEMLTRAHQKGVKKIICIGTSHEDSLAARDFALAHKDVYWTYGIHPESAGRVTETYFSDIISRFDFSTRIFLTDPRGSSRRDGSLGVPAYDVLEKSSPNVGKIGSVRTRPIAIGEVGLDYHYEGYDREAQIRLFEQMLQLAVDNGLPLSFHVREAFDDFFPVVSNFPKIHGVVHSFSDNKKNLKRILTETDFYVGVNGMATYSTLPTPPLERILLETDAPFLTPVPFRGIINECGYVFEVAQWLSKKLAVDFEVIERETTKNAEKVFRFSRTGL